MELLHSFLSEQMVERIGWVLVHFLWQGVAVAALVWCVLKAFGRASSNTRYVAACMGLILMAAAPVVTFMVLGEGVEVAASDEPMPVATTPAVAVQAPIETKTVVMAETEPMVLPESSFWEVLTARLEAALPYCVAGWFAGVAMLSVWYLGGWCQLQKLRRIGTKAVSEVISEKTSQLANRLDIKRAVRIVESALVHVPTVIGWLRPMVLLPATAMTGLDEMQLTAMIAHELAHIRRCDYLINIAQTVVEILGFYHPAVWWASRQIRIERENCCDDMAIALMANRKDYAGALFTMEAIRSKQLDLAVAANGGDLHSRISRLAGKPAKGPKSGWVVSIIAMIAVMAGCTLSMANKPSKLTTEDTEATEINDFKMTLPNGVTVELLGLGTAPWKDEQQWWKPDGTNMKQPELKFPFPLFEWKDQPNGAQFTCATLCKISNDSDIGISVPGASYSNGLIAGFNSSLTDDGMQMTYITWAPFLGAVPEKTDMSLAIGSKEFVQAKRVGNYTPQQHQRYYLEKNTDSVILHPLRIGQIGTPCVDMTYNPGNKNIEFRVFAKLKNGQTEQWAGGGMGEVQFYQSTPKGRNNTKIEDIEDIIIEYRTYEWITFKNVSLRPGGETKGEVQTDPAHEILLQRREILRRKLQEAQLQLEHGVGSTRSVRQVQVDLLRTESELAATPAERVQYLEQILDIYRQEAETVRMLIEVGQVPRSELDEIQLSILELRQQILQAREDKPIAPSAVALNVDGILLTLTEDGAVFYDGRQIGFSDVQPLVEKLLEDGDVPVMIEVNDARAQSELLVRIIDEVKLAGAEKISIATPKRQNGEPSASRPPASGDKAHWAVRDSGRDERSDKSEVTIEAKVITTGLTHEMISDFLNNELGVDASLSPEGLLCSVELTDAQCSALGRWMAASAGTSLLTSPSVRVFDGEESIVASTDMKKFITGYEGNTPKVEEVTPGIQFQFTPHVLPDESAIYLTFSFDKTTIIDVLKDSTADGKEIELPAVNVTTVNTTVIIPAGKTMLVPVGAGTKTTGEKDEQEQMILLIKTEVSEPSSVSAPPAMGGMSTPSRQEIAELLMGAWQALESGDSAKIDNYFYFENDAIKQRALPYLKPKLGDFSDYDDVHILDMTTLPDGSWEVFTLNPMPSSERCLIYSRLVVFADGRYKLKMCTQEYFDNRLDTTNLSPEQVGQIITEKALNKWKNATGQTLNELIQSEIQSLERALLAIQYAKVHHLKLVPLNAEEINKKIDKFRNTQPEKLKQEIIEKSSFTAENPLEIISAALEPIAQGKNTLYVTVKNNADNEQVFGVHIYTRSVDYGTQGVGWGIPFFETLQPGETKRARFVYKIQGPVTDNTYIRLKFYNPATEADYDYEQPFAERFYKGSDLQKRDVLKTLQRASEKQFAETSAALETVQNNIRNKQYEKAWSSFTEDYQRAEYQSRGFEAFKRQMEPEHELDSAFIWEKSDFLKLKPLKAFTDNGMLKLQAACEDAQWTVDFVKNVGVWKINWIAGYRPKVLDMQEADNEEAQQQKTTGENGKQEQTILLEMPGGFGGGLRPEEAIKFPKNWDETVAKYNKEHGIDPNEIRILEEVVPLDPNQLRTEVYDVADILHYPGTNRKPAEDIDALTQTIVQSIVSKSWSGNGGEGRIDHFRDDKLIIYQTPQVHEEIERYLKNLREELFKQVSIEARFLLVPDDFPKEFESSVDGQDIKLELPLSNQTAGQVVEGPANSEDVLAALEYEPEVKPGTVFDNFKKLDDLEVDFLRRAVQAHKNAKLLSAPKATVLNGEEACMQIQTERAYIGFDDETKYTNEGITLDMQPVMSADKRYVILKGSIQYSQVLESRSVEHGGKTYDIPTVQVVNLPVPRMNLEDKGTLLITGPDIKDPDNPNHEKQRLLILIKPTIIKQEEAEPELVK